MDRVKLKQRTENECRAYLDGYLECLKTVREYLQGVDEHCDLSLRLWETESSIAKQKGDL